MPLNFLKRLVWKLFISKIARVILFCFGFYSIDRSYADKRILRIRYTVLSSLYPLVHKQILPQVFLPFLLQSVLFPTTLVICRFCYTQQCIPPLLLDWPRIRISDRFGFVNNKVCFPPIKGPSRMRLCACLSFLLFVRLFTRKFWLPLYQF